MLKQFLTKLARALLRWAEGDTMSTDRSFRDPAAYTAIDITIDEPCHCRGVYVGGAGDIAIQARPGEDPVTFAVTDNQLLPVETYMVVNNHVGEDQGLDVVWTAGSFSPGGYCHSRVYTDKPQGLTLDWRNAADNITFDFKSLTPGATYRLYITEAVENTDAGTMISATSGATVVSLDQGVASISVDWTPASDNTVFNISGDTVTGSYVFQVRLVGTTGLTTATGVIGLK